MSNTAVASSPPVAPASANPILRHDFPGWLPPMLVKELRQGLRTRGFVGALMIFQTVMLVLMLWALAAQSALPPSVRTAGTPATESLFWTIVVVQLLIVTPARALGGLQLEVESRSIDLLMLTRLSAWRIVLGKWVSLLAQALLLLCAMLPYLVVRYFTDNADILKNLGTWISLFGVSAVLTAVGLWASGISKALRVILVVLVVFGGQVLTGVFGVRFFGGRPGSVMTGTSFTLIDSPLEIFDGALIAAFFLVAAVRKIAPAAENHAFFVRLLPIIAMLPLPFVAMFGAAANDVALRQLLFSAIFLAFVALFELSSSRWTMAVHWREWRRRGPFLRLLGRGALPGWESALFYVMVAGGIWAILALAVLPTGTVASRQMAERAASMGLLAVGGLVFPLVVRSMIRGKGQATSAMLQQGAYWSAIAIPIVFWAMAGALAESKWKIVVARNVMETIPVTSFLSVLSQRPQSQLMVSIARIVTVLTIGVALWQSRSHWGRLRANDEQDRGEAKPA